MGGFGALSAMNDAIKANREMLKIERRGHFDKASNCLSPRNYPGIVDKDYDPGVILTIRASAKRNASIETRRQWLLLGLSVLLGSMLLVFALKVIDSIT